jgi:hypothetical protein
MLASNLHQGAFITRYLHYDNLGSIDTITDGQGNYSMAISALARKVFFNSVGFVEPC